MTNSSARSSIFLNNSITSTAKKMGTKTVIKKARTCKVTMAELTVKI